MVEFGSNLAFKLLGPCRKWRYKTAFKLRSFELIVRPTWMKDLLKFQFIICFVTFDALIKRKKALLSFWLYKVSIAYITIWEKTSILNKRISTVWNYF
jgi:hypothetical protein